MADRRRREAHSCCLCEADGIWRRSARVTAALTNCERGVEGRSKRKQSVDLGDYLGTLDQRDRVRMDVSPRREAHLSELLCLATCANFVSKGLDKVRSGCAIHRRE